MSKYCFIFLFLYFINAEASDINRWNVASMDGNYLSINNRHVNIINSIMDTMESFGPNKVSNANLLHDNFYTKAIGFTYKNRMDLIFMAKPHFKKWKPKYLKKILDDAINEYRLDERIITERIVFTAAGDERNESYIFVVEPGEEGKIKITICLGE